MIALIDATNKMNADTQSTEVVDQKAETVQADKTVENNTNTVEETKEEKETKLKEHLANGRRLMRTAEFNKAADVLSIASQLAGEIFGDDAEESFAPFLLYGQALLELGKIEDQVFNNAMSNIPTGDGEEEQANNSIDEEQYGNPEKLTEEERDEIKQQVEDALAETSEEKTTEGEATSTTETSEASTENATTTETSEVPAENATATVTEEGNTEESEKNDEGTTEEETDEKKETEDVEMKDGEEGEEGGEEDGEEDEDDESSMKISWEILESARRICERKLESLAEDVVDEVKKWSLNKADVLTTLGEHSIADGKAEQALKDLQTALELQSCHLEPTSRILAQTSLLLGKAFRHDSQFEEATTHFVNSKNTISSKIDELKKSIESVVEEQKKTFEEEIKELEALLPEMDVYIDDSKASAEQTAKIKETLKKELEAAATVINNLTGNKEGNEEAAEAKDITSMIRRPAKRPASTEPAEEEAAKKTKSDEVTEEQKSEVVSETTEASTTN